MDNSSTTSFPWDSPKEYGRRFAEINERVKKSLATAEYRATGVEDTEVLQYRLAKLAIAGEDIRRAVAIIEEYPEKDEWIAGAIVELRSACLEVTDSIGEVDQQLIRMLNHFAG